MNKILARLNINTEDLFDLGVILIIVLITLGVGGMWIQGQNGIDKKVVFTSFDASEIKNLAGEDPETLIAEEKVFASKNGKRYYYSHCSGLSRILPANLISFNNAKGAEEAGYTIAAGCK